MADLCATVEFLLLNVVVIVVWPFLGIEKFPYSGLTLVLSVEALLLAIFILVQQRLEEERSKREAEADLKNDAIAAEASAHISEALDEVVGNIAELTESVKRALRQHDVGLEEET